MESFYIRINMDNTKIKYIEQASWLKTMDHYPKTIGQIKLLVSIFDKIGLFNKFNLSEIGTMESKRLNILYAVLRIMNKVFNKYLDEIIKNFYNDIYKKMFGNMITHQNDYDLIIDQLLQDTDHFVCTLIRSHYPDLTSALVKNKFVEHLKCTFQKSFYKNLFKKYNITYSIFDKYQNLFSEMSNEMVKITFNSLNQTYKSMKLFLDKIFSPECSYQTIINIMNLIESKVNLEELFNYNTPEVDIYSEQKIDDDIVRKEKKYNKIIKKQTINNLVEN